MKDATTKEFKNGNINITFTGDNDGSISDIELLNDALFWKDCYFIGEQYCLSNYDMGVTVYNCRRDLVYILSFSALDAAYNNNKTLKLYASVPDETDRELIDAWYNE